MTTPNGPMSMLHIISRPLIIADLLPGILEASYRGVTMIPDRLLRSLPLKWVPTDER
jgi:hypothetical protein